MEQENFLRSVQKKLLSRIGQSEELSDGEVLDLIEACLREEAEREILPIRLKTQLRQQIFDSVRRMDILSACLDDASITEIMVNGPKNIFVEQNGKLRRYEKCFTDEQVLNDLIQQVVAQVNRQVNASSPIADARLPDGSRVNIVLAPAALDGPVMTIRKFGTRQMRMEALLRSGSLTEQAAAYLRVLVEARYNLFISGGTGSGKTTLLNCLSEYIDPAQRVITVEDSAELQLVNIENLVRLETRSVSTEGAVPITIRDLIRCALRMRPDRLIVGEVRGEETIDMLQAMNTGHDGSLSTGHANSPADMLRRLETMVLMGMEIPLAAVRGQISSAIDIIVQVGRLRDGSRHVLSIEEVLPLQNGEIPLHTLFVFREEGERNGKVEGRLYYTGERLVRREKLRAAGKKLAAEEGEESPVP